MNIECVVEKLNNAIQKTHRVTGKNLSLPILSTLYLKAENNNLLIRATNLDLGVEVTIPVKVNKEGEVAVPADILSSYISSISKEQKVTLELDEGVLSLKTPSSKTKITTYPVDDFPQLPKINSKPFSINTHDLVTGLKSVMFSASQSSIKPELGSVYMYSDENNKLYFVATDSFRLSEKNITIKNSFAQDPILIPAKNIPEIVRILGDENKDIDISIENNQISFILDGVYITSRTVDGTFPDYKQIIPKDFSTKITLLKEDLLEALKVVNVFSNNLNQVKFSVGKEFSVATQNVDVGETINTIEGSIDGDGVEVTFNYKYIVECFSSITTDSVVLKLNAGNKPMVITPVDDSSFLYLVMPMNV